MVEYTCELCCKKFTNKTRYNSHLARKRPCAKPVFIENAMNSIATGDDAATTAAIVSSLSLPNLEVAKAENVVKPFLKWVGGKTQIIQEVISRFPTEMNNYHEPFVGGGSVLLALLTKIRNGEIKMAGAIYASDLNPHLIGLYRNIQSNPEEIIAEVKKLSDEYAECSARTVVNRTPATIDDARTSPESYYYWIRSQFNARTKDQRNTVIGSAMFLFMNKTCFRGVYREGPNGFNVPFGHYRNPSIFDEEHIRTVSILMRDVIFNTHSFVDSLQRISSGDFVYLDPPYAPENTKSFVAYTSDGFDIDKHRALFKLCGEMARKNVKFLMSNADVKLVKDAFTSPDYTTNTLSCRRAIHSKDPNTKTNEVLITN